MAGDGPREFAKRMRKVAQDAEQNVGKTVRKAALVIDRELVLSTPVDTGRARSNWIASVDKDVQTAIPPYSEGSEGSTAGPNANAAMDQANKAIGGFDVEKNASIFISNNLPYVPMLNQGSSPQRGPGWVEAAVLVGRRVVERSRLLGRGENDK